MNHLYWIKNKEGKRVKFRLNWAQQELVDGLHTCNIVLKARQLGITTFGSILLLDHVLWEDNKHAGVLAHTLEDAQNIFRDKLKYAFDNLHPSIRALFQTVGDSAKELSFKHGSVIRVGTSLRSATLNYLHISEFGKVCARYPERAREIVTGSLNTVHAGQFILIESTAEGKEGYFHDLYVQAELNAKRGNLSSVDFKPFFFPWWKEPEYSLGTKQVIPDHLVEYFDKLSASGIIISDPQKWWYASKYATQKEDMFREFPSTSDEAFFASQEGYWYASDMKALHDSGHITDVSYDRSLPVHTAWDLGQSVGNETAIWFFQLPKSGDIRVIDYFERANCPIDQVASVLQSKGYNYGKHLWPFDANSRDKAGITFVKQAREFGLTGIVLEQHGLRDGINMVKMTLSKCWFDAKRCHMGLISLENYQRKWSTQTGSFTAEPLHNRYSNGSDSLRYLVSGLSKIQGSGTLENDMKAIRNFWGG